MIFRGNMTMQNRDFNPLKNGFGDRVSAGAKDTKGSIFARAKTANEKEKNAEKAERLYLEAIQKNDRPGSAAADLVRLMMHNHKLEKAAEYLERYGSKYMREKAYENVRKQLIERDPKLEDKFFLHAEKAKVEEDYFGLAQKAGKEDPLKAIDYYNLAITNRQRLTSSVPNLVQLYIRLEKFDEALSLLDDVGKAHMDYAKYLNLRLAVFSTAKNKKYKQEIQETYQQMIHLSASKEKHTALLFDQAYLMNQIGAYEDAIELYKQCQDRMRQGIYPVPDKANYGKQDLRALSGLCKACLELREYEKAKEYAKEILAVQRNNKFAKSVLGGQVDEAKYYDQISDYKISAYILQKINDLHLRNKLRKKDKECIKGGEFVGTAEKAKHIISGIQQQIDKCMNDKYVNDEVQSNNYFVIAKLIRQIIDRDGENYDFNEGYYKLEIAYGSFFYGNYRLCTPRLTHNNPDTARYCFFMPILIFQDVERLHRDWAVATIMYLEACFSSEEIKHDAKLYYDFRDDKENYDNKIKSIMQRKISSSYEEFVVAMLEMLEYNPKTKKVVLSNLYKKAEGEERILDALGHVADAEIPDSIDFKQFESFWDAATQKYRAKRKIFIDIIEETIKSAFRIGQLLAYQNRFKESEFHAYLTKTDKERMGDLKKIFNVLRKYNEESEFAYKAENLEEADKIRKRLEEEIAEHPTYIGYEKLMPMLHRFQAKIVEEAATFYGGNKPDITVELTGDCSIDTQQIVRAPIAFRNKNNVQNADNVSIKISGEGVDVMGDRQLSRGLLLGNGKAQERLVCFKVTPEILKNQAFTVEVVIEYQYKKSMTEIENARMDLLLPIKLYSDAAFEPIENKFEAYRNGSEVKDESMFYGREADIQNIIRQISDKFGCVLQGRCLALYGQTRTGKSSLRYHLEKRLRAINEEGNVIVNTGSIGEQDLSKDITEFLYTLLDGLEYEIRSRHPVLKNILKDAGIEIDAQKLLDDPEHSQLYFNNVFKKINRCIEDCGHKYNIIVMIDEFTYIYDWIRRGIMTDRFMKFWKAFIQNNGVSAIIIGQDHMMDFVEQFENDFGAIDFHKVTYLSEKYAKQLMYEPIMLVAKDGKKVNRYQEGALERLYELTAGSAFLIMKLCAGLVSYLNETRTVYITRAHIDEYLKKNLSTFEEVGFFESQYKDKSNIGSGKAGEENNKRVLKKIAQLSNKKEWALLSDVIEEKEDKEIVDSLEKRDVIIVSEGKRCKIKVALYKEWMIKKYGTEDDNG